MGLQELIAVILLVAAVVFISYRTFFRFKKKAGGAGCNDCGCEPGKTKKSELKA